MPKCKCDKPCRDCSCSEPCMSEEERRQMNEAIAAEAVIDHRKLHPWDR
jgi:hypothetical protein